MKKITWSRVLVGVVIVSVLSGVGSIIYRHRRDASKVEVTVGYNADCKPTHPILIVVKNNSQRSVVDIEIAISIHENGHSSTNYVTLHDDFIVKPGAVREGCWDYPGIPLNNNNLIYSFNGKSTTFE